MSVLSISAFLLLIARQTYGSNECTFLVTNVKDSGKYFYFDTEAAGELLGRPYTTGWYNVFNERTGITRNARMWDSGIGRRTPRDDRQSGDWQIGDILSFTDIECTTIRSDVSCKTVTGAKSGDSDDAISAASCPAGYTLTSCGIQGYWPGIDGSYIEDETCYAQNGAQDWPGTFVRAKARCCTLHSSIDCDNVSSAKSGPGDDEMTTAQCAENKILTGCTAHTFWNHIDGAISMIEKDATNLFCAAFNGNGGLGVYAEARCCDYDDTDYHLECVPVRGTISGTSDDAKSFVSCPSGYFMAGCSGHSPFNAVEAWYIDGSDRCLAQAEGNGHGVYSMGTCCKELLN